MAHLHGRGPQAPTAAIFSPSVARAAASTAKDWSYVDGWLRSKYPHPQNPPSFERNPDTLRALLALASHNEAGDEQRDQLARVEEAALEEVKAVETAKARTRAARGTSGAEAGAELGESGAHGGLIADDILQAIEGGLTREGRTALETMATMAVDLAVAYPTAEALGCRFVELQGKAFELEQSVERVAMLRRYLDRESKELEVFVSELRGDEYRADAKLARQNLELQKQVKALSSKIPELQQQVASLETSVGMPGLTVEDVVKDEDEYLKLLTKKKDLDAQIKAFAGLPSDVEAARVELEALRTHLRDATERRDEVFEGLVERESPAKTRRRP